jgi:hypothetical protein
METAIIVDILRRAGTEVSLASVEGEHTVRQPLRLHCDASTAWGHSTSPMLSSGGCGYRDKPQVVNSSTTAGGGVERSAPWREA